MCHSHVFINCFLSRSNMISHGWIYSLSVSLKGLLLRHLRKSILGKFWLYSRIGNPPPIDTANDNKETTALIQEAL